MDTSTVSVDLSKARPGQQNAIQTIIQNAESGQRNTGIVLPTRYGKSDVIRVSSAILFLRKMASINVVVNINTTLRNQIVDKDKVRDCWHRYRLEGYQQLHKVSTISDKMFLTPSRSGLKLGSGDEFLLSINIQLLQQNLDIFLHWVESCIYRTGIPVFFHFDEIHMTSEINRWGEAMKSLMEAGAYIIGYTATPMRADNEMIVGFGYEEKDRHYTSHFTYEDIPETDQIKINLYEGERVEYSLTADYEHTFEQAWNEQVICQISRTTVEADLQKIDEISQEYRLSELSLSDTRRFLGKIVRDKQLIHDLCVKGVRRLGEMRQIPVGYGNLQMIVFCQNDAGTNVDNQHAKDIRDALNKIDKNLKVGIATTKSGSSNIKKFRNGQLDVLIVKRMGGTGLDVPTLKVVVDLSSTRTVGDTMQRWMRGATRYNSLLMCHLITPNDCLANSIFTQFIERQGGAYVDDVELTETYITSKNEKPSQPDIYVDQTYGGHLDDSSGRKAEFEQLELVLILVAEFRDLPERYTYPEIASKATKMRDKLLPQTTPISIINTEEQINSRRKRISNAVNQYCNYLFYQRFGTQYRGDAKSQKKYQTLIKEIYRDIHQYVWNNGGQSSKLKAVSDEAEMDIWENAAHHVLRGRFKN